MYKKMMALAIAVGFTLKGVESAQEKVLQEAHDVQEGIDTHYLYEEPNSHDQHWINATFREGKLREINELVENMSDEGLRKGLEQRDCFDRSVTATINAKSSEEIRMIKNIFIMHGKEDIFTELVEKK